MLPHAVSEQSNALLIILYRFRALEIFSCLFELKLSGFPELVSVTIGKNLSVTKCIIALNTRVSAEHD